MKRRLLVTGQPISREATRLAARGLGPRLDVAELARSLEADVLARASSRASLPDVAVCAALAWRAFRRAERYRTILTTGEDVGIPLAVLLRGLEPRPRHVMISHVLSPWKKRVFFVAGDVSMGIDHFLVYSREQERLLEGPLSIDRAKITRIPFHVDTRFFRPLEVPSPVPEIASAGLERRDYATLFRAVEGLDATLTVAAHSPWARAGRRRIQEPVPGNVRLVALDARGLRHLYARSRFVVIPVEEVDFQAGIATLLEGMAMGRAVITARTCGRADAVVHESNGLEYPPGDWTALRGLIRRLLEEPEETQRMGSEARARVVQTMDTGHFVERVGRVVREVEAEGGRAGLPRTIGRVLALPGSLHEGVPREGVPQVKGGP